MSQTENVYEIRIQGHLAPRRLCHHFRGLAVNHRPDGQTVLSGSLRDQAALYGLLHCLQNMGLALVAVNRLEKDREGEK